MTKLATVETDIEAVAKRVETAIEDWYERHFHRAATAGQPPITTTDKVDLTKSVAAAIKPKAE